MKIISLIFSVLATGFYTAIMYLVLLALKTIFIDNYYRSLKSKKQRSGGNIGERKKP